MAPYALLSDQHAHGWSAFATIGPNGVNTRLQWILDEMARAATELLAAGGDTMIFAGDLFHERGKIDPEVFNPVHDTIRNILSRGVQIIAIPGNHDLKGKNTTKLGNAMQSLGALEGFTMLTQPAFYEISRSRLWNAALVPWFNDLVDLRKAINEFGGDRSNADLIIHAGIDGVLPGMPDHGLTAKELAGYGFKRVFAGHYHHHKAMEGDKVFSIGALTHQSWRDIGSKAGFLLVYPDRVDYRASRAPSFIEIDSSVPEEEIPLLVEGNYARIRGRKLSGAKVNELREELTSHGAIGSLIEVLPEEVVARDGSVKTTGATLETSVESFIDGMSVDHAADVKRHALEVLASVRSVAA